MTDNNHPITPPPELVEQWRTAPEYASALEKLTMVTMTDRRLQEIAIRAARWGADTELEACCEFLSAAAWEKLLKARRPEPLSLKQQAFDSFDFIGKAHALAGPDWAIIRRALEALPDA